jgi:MtN3 and saliva related transmembrane protein
MKTWMLLVGISMALSGCPQIYKLIKSKTSKEVSLIMWLIVLHGQLWYTYYGYYIKDLPVFITNITCVIITSILIYLTLKYRRVTIGVTIKWNDKFLLSLYSAKYFLHKILV